VLLRKLEGLRRDSIACCKCPSKQRDASVDGEEPQLLSEDQSCLLKEADVEAESQRVERLDADFTAPNEGVCNSQAFYCYFVLRLLRIHAVVFVCFTN
jgi:hypothetical protein